MSGGHLIERLYYGTAGNDPWPFLMANDGIV